MSWLKPNLRNSLYGMLGNPPRPSDSIMENGTEDIRESMLAMLGQNGPLDFPRSPGASGMPMTSRPSGTFAAT